MKNWNKILILALWIALVLILADGWRIRHEIKSYSRAIDTVDVGTTANDGTGDPLRTAFIKINEVLYMLDTLGVEDLDATDVSYIKETTSAIQTQLNAKAPIASPTFTGTVTTAAIKVGGTTLGIDSISKLITGYLAVYDAADTLPYYTPDAYTDNPYDIFPEIHAFAGDTSNYATPDKIGDLFINTATSKVYVSVSTSRGGWVIINIILPLFLFIRRREEE